MNYRMMEGNFSNSAHVNLTWNELLNMELQNRTTGLIIFECFLMIIINILTLGGNITLCVVIMKTPCLLTTTNMYVLALAVSSSLNSALVTPITIGVLVKGRWIYDFTICQIQGFLMLFFTFSSLQTMSLVALNRFFCMVKTNLYKRLFRRSYCKIMIVLVWVVSFIAALTPLATSIGEFAFRGGRSSCFITIKDFQANLIYTGTALLLFVLSPLTVVIVSYTLVFRKLHQHAKNVSGNVMQATTQEIKVTKQLFILVLGFGICWIPCIIIELLDSALPGGALSRTTYMAYVYLAYISDALNPILYSTFNRPFRKALINIMCCKENIVGTEQQKTGRQKSTWT